MSPSKFDFLPLYIGNKIKERRQELDITQFELSEKLHISRASVSNIESGRQLIQITTLYEISELLSINISYFLPNSTANKDFYSIFHSDFHLDKNLDYSDSHKDYVNSLIKGLSYDK